MKYTILLSAFLIVACQQPTSTSFLESEQSISLTTNGAFAQAASGVVTWTNKSGNAGKITTATGAVFQYNVKAGHTVNGYKPKVGDKVTFQAGPGAVARQITLGLPPIGDDNGGGGGGGNDDDDDQEPDPVCLPGQYLGADKVCYWIPS